MEKALRELGERTLAQTEHLRRDWTLVQEYPLSRELLALSHVWQSPDGEEYVIAVKGAPEAIADLCHFTAEEMAGLSEKVATLASEGLRVLGVAKASFRKIALPDVQHDFRFESLGLVDLSDPVRPDVPAAIQECYQAGIRVVTITGDYPRNRPAHRPRGGARGARPGAHRPGTGPLRLVNTLKANGEIVAMTGDGVNDAPALKSAHIGLAARPLVSVCSRAPASWPPC
ncbi:MAG: HAD family hydrolase [Bacillota bacterium]|nr:HAD family hydrolase [Bacillota bacterium]